MTSLVLVCGVAAALVASRVLAPPFANVAAASVRSCIGPRSACKRAQCVLVAYRKSPTTLHSMARMLRQTLPVPGTAPQHPPLAGCHGRWAARLPTGEGKTTPMHWCLPWRCQACRLLLRAELHRQYYLGA
eukprot:365990-Chlamydomonas_euryale.AAC.14